MVMNMELEYFIIEKGRPNEGADPTKWYLVWYSERCRVHRRPATDEEVMMWEILEETEVKWSPV
jgi:hypothetical protein